VASPTGATYVEAAAARLGIPFVALAALIAFLLVAFVPQTVLPGGSNGGIVGGALNPRLDVLVGKILLFGVFFFVLVVRRSVRIRTAELGGRLPHATAHPEQFFADLARRSTGAAIPFAAAIVTTLSLTGLVVALAPSANLYAWDQLPLFAFFTFWRIFALALGVYTFAVVAWGMYRYAQQPLDTVSYFEDPALGLGPLGAFTISLVVSYVILMALVGLFALVSANALWDFGVLAAMGILGLVFFLQPLRVFHGKMLGEKTDLQRQLRHRFRLELQKVDLTGKTSGGADPSTILALEAVEKQVEGIRTWPFATGAAETLFSRLLFPIVLSITAGVILHYVLNG
jgi:hypothetical protein